MPKPLKFADEKGTPIKPARLTILIHPSLLDRIKRTAMTTGKTIGDWLSSAAEKAME